MSEMVLLGAGASVEAGVPDSYAMTGKIAEQFKQNMQLQRHSHVLSFVIGGLLFQQGIKGGDPLTSGVNVEELFNAVELLSQRNILEAAPFVGSWHSMVEELDKEVPYPVDADRLHQAIYESVTSEILNAFPQSAPGFVERDIDTAVQKIVQQTMRSQRYYGGSFGDELGRAVSRLVRDTTKTWFDNLRNRRPHSYTFQQEFENALQSMKERPGQGRIFHETNEVMIHTLANIVWIEQSDRVAHLKPLLNLLNKQKRLVVVTLNYDNSIELLAEAFGFACPTGIEKWSESGAFALPSEGLSLLKLHGSIDWALDRGKQSDQRPMPQSAIRRVAAVEFRQQQFGFRPAVVFGHRNKLTAEGPFLDLLRAFQHELSGCELLTVVGYSFRDEHVNEFISHWLNENAARKLRVIDPLPPETHSEYARQLKQFCPARIEKIPVKASEGLKNVFGACEIPLVAPPQAVAIEVPSDNRPANA